MKLGIDLDCVLNNWCDSLISRYNFLYNDSLTPEDIHCWDIAKYVKCGKEIFKLLDDSLLESFEPQAHSIEVTKRLSEKHDLYITTATDYRHVKTKVEWVYKYFPHIKTNNIIICYDKSLLYGLDWLIDDGLHNIESFPRGVIIMDYAWNRNAPDFYPRAKNWLEIEQMLSGFDF